MVLPAKRKAPAQPRRSTRNTTAAAAASSSQNGTDAAVASAGGSNSPSAAAAAAAGPARGRSSSSPRRRKRTRRTPAAAAAAASDNAHGEEETTQYTAADATASNSGAHTAASAASAAAINASNPRANIAASAVSAASANNAVDRAEFEAFRRLVDRDPDEEYLANLLWSVDPDAIPPTVMRAIRQDSRDVINNLPMNDNGGNSGIGEDGENDVADSGNDGDSMPQLEAAEPPCSPSRLVTCAICLEAFQPSSLVTLPCCAESEATSSTRFCPGCIAGLAHHEMITYHVSYAEEEANYRKRTCVVGECPRCKRLLSVTNRNPPSFLSFEDSGCEFSPDQEHFSWTVDSIGLRLASVEMSVEYACRYAWRTNYGLGALMDMLGFLSYLPFPGMILEQSLEYIHDSPTEVRRIVTRLVQWGLLGTIRPGVYCLSDKRQAELLEGRFRQLMSHPSGRLRPLGHRYFSHYAKFVPWEVDLDDMSTAAIRSFLTFSESLSNCATVTGYLLLTVPMPLLEFRIWRFVLLLWQTVVALAMSLGVVPGRVGPVSYPQQAVIFLVMATVLYLLWSIVKTIVWCGFVGCVAISIGRSLYSLRPPSRGCTSALFLLLHHYSDREGSHIYAWLFLACYLLFRALNPPRHALLLYYAHMLCFGYEAMRLLSLRRLDSVGSVSTCQYDGTMFWANELNLW